MANTHNNFRYETKRSRDKCFLCKSRVGCYKHHIDPEHRESTRLVWLCELCHNKVELEPALLTPRAHQLEMLSKAANDDGRHFIHRDGGMLWFMGIKTCGKLEPVGRLISLETYWNEAQAAQQEKTALRPPYREVSA